MNQDRARRLFRRIKGHPTGLVSDPVLRDDVTEWILQAAGDENTHFQKHPFGFLKAVLGKYEHEDISAVFRLHVWHPTVRYRQLPQPVCHNHAWRLASYVLHGPLTNTNYRMLPETDGPLYKLFHVFVAEGTVTVARPIEEAVGAETISEDRLTGHCVYHVDRGVLHTTSADDDTLAITLAILYDRAPVPVMNLRRSDDCDEAPFDQAFLDPEDNSRVRHDILAALDATFGSVNE